MPASGGCDGEYDKPRKNIGRNKKKNIAAESAEQLSGIKYLYIFLLGYIITSDAGPEVLFLTSGV